MIILSEMKMMRGEFHLQRTCVATKSYTLLNYMSGSESNNKKVQTRNFSRMNIQRGVKGEENNRLCNIKWSKEESVLVFSKRGSGLKQVEKISLYSDSDNLHIKTDTKHVSVRL